MTRPKYRSDQAVLRADVWDASDKHCHYCGVELHPLRNFCIDHVIPKCAGGDDDLGNLVASCRTCNHRKGVTSDMALCNRLNRTQPPLRNGYAIRGDLIRDYEARHELTRPQFAKLVGVGPGLVREAEEGRYMVLGLIMVFARAMNVDYVELVRDVECLKERIELDAAEFARLRELARNRPRGEWVRGIEMVPGEAR